MACARDAFSYSRPGMLYIRSSYTIGTRDPVSRVPRRLVYALPTTPLKTTLYGVRNGRSSNYGLRTTHTAFVYLKRRYRLQTTVNTVYRPPRGTIRTSILCREYTVHRAPSTVKDRHAPDRFVTSARKPPKSAKS